MKKNLRLLLQQLPFSTKTDVACDDNDPIIKRVRNNSPKLATSGNFVSFIEYNIIVFFVYSR